MKSLVFQKEKFYCNKKGSSRGHLALEISVVNVIKFITLCMNLWLKNITLSCRVFIINVYMENFAGVDYVISIYRNTH